jgi:transcriptional regulator with XRE-family HTH domain
MPITLAERIKELVEQHGSFRSVSRTLKIDHVYLWRLANGARKQPSPETLRKLGLRVEASVQYFKTGE